MDMSAQTLHGVIQGDTIQLDQSPGLPSGTVVRVTVETDATPTTPTLPPGEGLRRRTALGRKTVKRWTSPSNGAASNGRLSGDRMSRELSSRHQHPVRSSARRFPETRVEVPPAHGQLYTSTLNLGELFIWAHKSPKSADRLQEIQKMLADVTPLVIDVSVAEQFGVVRAQQLASGTLTPALDLFVACTALAHNYTLVTHNITDFVGIPGLRVVDG
jgi:tRNA(fMet)-specific endonuclease VapC